MLFWLTNSAVAFVKRVVSLALSRIGFISVLSMIMNPAACNIRIASAVTIKTDSRTRITRKMSRTICKRGAQVSAAVSATTSPKTSRAKMSKTMKNAENLTIRKMLMPELTSLPAGKGVAGPWSLSVMAYRRVTRPSVSVVIRCANTRNAKAARVAGKRCTIPILKMLINRKSPMY